MKRNLLSILGILLIFTSCRINNDEDRVVEIDPVFSIDLIQDLKEFGKLNVIVQSVELQDCENYSISINCTKTPTEIDLDLIKIAPPLDCVVGIAPAQSIVQLENIGNNRSYNLKIALQDAVDNKGKLIINNKSFRIEMDSWDGLGFVREELIKIPTKTVWGYVAYDNTTSAGQLSEDFLKDIADLGQELNLEEGYYGYFNVHANNNISVVNSPNVSYVKHFILYYTGDLENLEALLNNYRNEPNGGDLEIKVQTWNGEEF